MTSVRRPSLFVTLPLSTLALASLWVLPGCGPATETDTTVSPSGSPTPAASPVASATPATTPTATPAPSTTPTATPAPSATPTATPAPSATPTPTPGGSRTSLQAGPFSEAAPGSSFVASNSLFTFSVPSSGRLEVRATWPDSAQVRLYIYTGSCTPPAAEANTCGSSLLANTASGSPHTLTTASAVAAGVYTVRLENMGPGATGSGQFEVTLIQ